MASPLQVFNVAAGTPGSPYLKVLSFLAKAVGNYVINDTNFPGVGKFLPGWVFVASGTAANVGLQLSTDNGTTWKVLYGSGTAAAPSNGGGLAYGDAPGTTGVSPGVSTNATVRVVIVTGATDIFLYPLGI